MPVNPIVPKRNSTAGSSTGPAASALQTGEIATNTFLGKIFLKTEAGAVKPIGSDASELSTGTMPAGRLPALSGDVSSSAGSNSLTVTKLQGAAVSATAPTSGQLLVWNNTASQWEPTTISIPSASVGGDLSGTVGNATVTKIRGSAVSASAPFNGAYLRYSTSTNSWQPEAVAMPYVLSMSGDVIAVVTNNNASTTVAGLMGVGISPIAPTSGQALLYNGSAWAPGDITLPSYVDDVLEYPGTASFPATGETGKIYVDTTTNTCYRWSGSTYVAITSGGQPTGSAGGDLGGTYPNPTVAKLQGRTVATTAPTSGQVLSWNSSTSQWEPATVASGSATLGGDISGTTSSATVEKIQGVSVSATAPTLGQVLKYNGTAWAPAADTDTGITALTGDVTASGSGSQAATVARLQGRTLASTAPTSGQALAWNATSSQWEPATLTTSAVAPVLTSFTGNGSTTLFAISGYTNTNPANYLVVVGGVPQRPDSSVYTVSSSGVQLSVAPANGVSGYVLAYQAPTGASPLGYTAVNKAGDTMTGALTLAADPSSALHAATKQYTDTADALKLDKAGGTLTGALNEAQGANVASASTVNLTTATGNYVQITGTTTITAITLTQGAERTVVFAGALTLTNGASLILPGGANITTAAGDVAMLRGEAAGVVRCVAYTRANGQAVSSSGGSSGGGGGIKIFDTAGANQSWTVPAGVTSVKITVIGGGGGTNVTSTGPSGGTSTCSIGGTTVTATGGGGGYGLQNAQGWIPNGAFSSTGGSVAAVPSLGLGAGTGGTATTGSGSSGGYGGEGGGGSTGYDEGAGMYNGSLFAGGTGIGRTTGNGYGAKGETGGFGAGSGSAGGGGYAVYTIAVTPGQTYSNSVTVGAGGAGNYFTGARGAVIVEW